MARTHGAWTLRLLSALILIYGFHIPATAAECGSRPVLEEFVRVRYVVDGDTVVLDDQRHLRLIGIDAPELAHGRRQEQPYAREARQGLTDLLGSASRVALVYDRAVRDRYRRFLAHVFLPNGASLAEQLLRRGLARTLIIPPNIKFADCYAQAERAARRQQRALWSTAAMQPLPANSLDPHLAGERVVYGRVFRLRSTASAVFLDLSDAFSVSIAKRELGYFRGLDLATLPGQAITVHGRVYRRRYRSYIRIRHPAALAIGEALSRDLR